MQKLLKQCVYIRVKMMRQIVRRYSELKQMPTFEERFNYLKLNGNVGVDTFGFDRYLNQMFYRSNEWKHIRDIVIVRDLGCDLGVEGYEINSKIYIHHMNPITTEDIKEQTRFLVDPEFLICVTHNTHNALHYGVDKTPYIFAERKPGDTCPWKTVY